MKFLQYDPKDDADDGENLRFVRNFSDLFIAVALVVLLIGINLVVTTTKLPLYQAHFVMAAISWLGAEYVTKVRRLTLPSIVLASAFVTFVTSSFAEEQNPVTQILISISTDGFRTNHLTYWVVGFLASLLHILRFRLPFVAFMASIHGYFLLAYFLVATVDPSGLMEIASVWAGEPAETLIRYVFVANSDHARDYLYWLSLLYGVLNLFLAINSDLRDPERILNHSDMAFWLYLIGSTLTIHPVGYSLIDGSTFDSIVLLVFILGLFGLFLLMNRRIGVFTLCIYFVITLTTIQGYFAAFSQYFLLSLGLIATGIGLFWRSLRVALLGIVPDSAFKRRLPQQ